MSTLKVDTIRPVTTDNDLVLQGDSSGAGVTGAKVFGDGSLGADSVTDLAGTGAPDFPNGLTLSGSLGADSITDSAGTGAPDFPNGLTLSGSLGADSITDSAGTGAPDFTNGWKSEGLDAYACRAWVNFNGTGTVAIRASGNVSSITDNGTGNYTLNFTTAMPDASYSAIINAVSTLSGRTADASPYYTGTYSTSAVQIFTKDSADVTIDSSIVNASIFR